MTALEAKLQLAALEADPSLVDEIWEGLMRELEADLISARRMPQRYPGLICQWLSVLLETAQELYRSPHVPEIGEAIRLLQGVAEGRFSLKNWADTLGRLTDLKVDDCVVRLAELCVRPAFYTSSLWRSPQQDDVKALLQQAARAIRYFNRMGLS